MSTDPRALCGTKLTIDEVQSALLEHFHLTDKDNHVKSFEATEIGAGKGFLSVMAKVQLVWDKECEKLPKTVVIKIPSTIQFDRMVERMNAVEDEKQRAAMAAFANFGDTVKLHVVKVSGD